MEEQIIEIEAMHIDILRSTLFAVLCWDFENIDTHGFNSKEIDKIDILLDKLRHQVEPQYKKQGVHLGGDFDLLRKKFVLRKKNKVIIALNNSELSLSIRAIDIIEMEFKDDIFEFMTVTPHGLEWYNHDRDEKGISLQDIHDCRDFLKQIGSVNIG